jgi:hypothetical protein
MNQALNQLILLGFLCQGLTWDDYFLPLANAALWFLCAKTLRGRLRISATAEAILLPLGSAVSYWMCGVYGKSSHFFIGHGITLVLASRLLRDMNRREQLITLAMACLQLGVGCTFLFDLRFTPILAGAVIILPRALMELEASAFEAPPIKRRLTPQMGEYFILMAAMAVLFVAMPRGNWGAPIRSFRSDTVEGGASMDSELDLLRTARPMPSEVFMQIQGERLGWLRCYTLISFNGKQWREGSSGYRQPFEPAASDRLKDSLVRKAHMKSASVLRRVLPSDGAMLKLEGNFFSNPQVDSSATVECEGMWSTANNAYTYWMDPDSALPSPSPGYKQWLTFYPPQSEKLCRWLDDFMRDEPDPLRQAKRLENYFHRDFTYSLESPKLAADNPIDDFLFQQKQGHCERFAGAMALLLRMRGIPSRVVLGYVPGNRAWFTGGYAIRHSDAHAWVEAWFDSIGWQTFDATPSSGGQTTLGRLRDFWTSLDLLWTLNVVGFDHNTQSFTLSSVTGALENAGDWLSQHWRYGALAGFLVAALYGCGTALGFVRVWRWPFSGHASEPEAVVHFYDEMLRCLASRGFRRKPHQTPIEFAGQLTAAGIPHLADIQLITQAFCDFRYGHARLDSPRQAAVRASLDRILAAK